MKFLSFSATKRLPEVKVGTQSLFYIVAHDKFGNHVNADNTVAQSFSVQVLQCGLKFPLDTQAESPSLTQILAASNKNCECDTKYLNNGVFEVKCIPYCSGHGPLHVSFTGSGEKTVMSQLHGQYIEVKHGPPSAPHSRIHYDRTTIAVNKMYSHKLYLFDKYYNSVQPSKLDFKRMVRINVVSEDGNTDVDFSITKLNRYFVLSFRAKSLSRLYTILITIDGVNVPQTPLVISVTNLQPALMLVIQQKLSALYASLRSHRKPGLPTQTVERKHILNSALRILSDDNLSYCLRVRFDDEGGMDLGGLSK